MKSLISVVVFFSTVFIGNVYADARGAGADDFFNQIQTYRKACAVGCTAPFKNEDAFSSQDPVHSHLAKEIQETLKTVAVDQAQIWADTILEGDYFADGNTRLDQVTLIFKDDKFIGYHIVYSERAWYTGECNFNGDDEQQLKDCLEGRIQESAYVSPDFKTYFRDEDSLADFAD